MRILFFLLFPFLLHSFQEWSFLGPKEIEVDLILQEEKVEVDEKVVLSLSIRAPDGIRLDEQALAERFQERSFLFFQQFFLQEITADDSQTVNLTFLSKMPGTVILNFLNIPFIDENGNEILVPGELISVEVGLTVDELTDLKELSADIAPLTLSLPMKVSETNRKEFLDREDLPKRNVEIFKAHRFPFIRVFSLLTAACFLLTAYWILPHLWKLFEAAVFPEPTPRKKALRKIKKLKSSPSMHSSIKKILQEYIQNEYKLRVEPLTTDEMRKYHFPFAKEQLIHFLQVADQVEYADYSPSKDENQKAISFANEFVSRGR